MKPTAAFSGLAALLAASFNPTVAAADEVKMAAVYIQPVMPNPPSPSLLAEIEYNPFVTPGAPDAAAPATISKYEAPDLGESHADLLLRVGIYDPSSGLWLSSTSTASAANVADKGYSPTVLLTVEPTTGEVVAAALRGVRIDAGQTRDFGPQAVLRVTNQARGPELNKPVVLSADGKKVPPPEEKSLLQKYWWVLALLVVVSVAGGGDDKK